jgi:GGDEF domain-containing protein
MADRTAERVYGKRVLVELSHTIEQYALAAPPDEPLVVVAMFQKASYFAREAEVYRDIAARGAVTVVGLAEDLPPHLPPGVRHALVDARDPLAREWSVTVLGPRGGATLVATDLETVDATARTLEEGRSFRAHWSFRRDAAYHELLRLRTVLPLPAARLAEVDRVLQRVVAEPEPERQAWWDAPLRFLGARLDQTLRGRAEALAALAAAREDERERDPRTGLHTPAFLERWTAGLGAGTLPIGLALLRVPGIAGLRASYGFRAELAALQGVTGAVHELITEADRVVRLGRDEFLLVLPSWEPHAVLRLCDEVCARVAELDQVYPFVALPAVAAGTVTRDRPLPVGYLQEQVARGGTARLVPS